MNKLMLVAVCFFCCGVCLKGSVCEDSGILWYLANVLQYPPVPLLSWETSHAATADQTSKEVGGLLSTVEQLLLFPICLLEDRSNKPLGKEGETGHGLQICKASSDMYLLEYVIVSGKNAINDMNEKLIETWSLLEWENLLVPIHNLKAKFLYFEHLPSMMSRFESLLCHSYTSECATKRADSTLSNADTCTISNSDDRDSNICTRTEDVVVVSTWALIRYIIAGILALSLLRSVNKIDIRKIVGAAKCPISKHENMQLLAGGPHLPKSPVAEENSLDVSVLSFFRAFFFLIPFKIFSRSTLIEKFSEFEHYQMCEYFDTRTCNCGGKPVSSEESSKSRHFKMCEFFDSMPCNCGGIDEKSNADYTKCTENSKDIPVGRRNGSFEDVYERIEVTKDSHVMKEQSVQVVPDVISRDTSPDLILETDKDENVLTDNDRLLQIVQRLVDNCITLNYPHLSLFKSRTVPKISTCDKDDKTVSTEDIDNSEHQGADDGPYINPLNTFRERMTGTAYPPDSKVPVKFTPVCKGSDSEFTARNGEISSNNHETVNGLASCTGNDLDGYSTAPTSPFDSFASKTSQTAEIVRLSQRISDLINIYEVNMSSNEHRALNENVGHLNMDKEFIKRLNTLLSEGYKLRYCSANLCTGNLLPTFPVNVKNITKPYDNDDKNNKEFDDSTHSKEATAVHTDHEITVSSKKIEFVDKKYNAMNSQPNNLHDDINDNEKVNKIAGNNAEMPEKESEKVRKNNNTGNKMVDNVMLFKGPKSQYLEEDSESQYLEEGTKSQYLEDESKFEYLEKEHKSKYVQEDFKTVYLEKESKSEYEDDESKSEYLEEESKSEYLEEDSCESFFDLSERDIGEPEYLDKESKSEDLGEDLYKGFFDLSERNVGKFVYFEGESMSECLEENSNESLFNLSERDIGSPCHNSSFKDNSPYTTAETVPFESLQACGDGAMYYTLTRRSPFSEAGLNDLSVDISAKDNEKSIFDVSDLNSSISFDRDTGILELAVIFAMKTIWRLAKRFWQKKVTNSSHSAVAIEEKENGLFVIGQMDNSRSLKSPILTVNNSAATTENNQDVPFESCSVNKIQNGSTLNGNSATNNVDNSGQYDTSNNLAMHVQDNKFSDECPIKSLNSESSEDDDVFCVANNQNNNARVWKQINKKAKRKKAVCENNVDCNERDCSKTETEASHTDSKWKTTERKSSMEYRSGDTRKLRISRNKYQTAHIRLPLSSQNERKRRSKRISQAFKGHSNRRRSLHCSPNTVSENHDSSGSSSYRSGDMADESSSSSDEKLDIRDSLSKMGICDVVSGKLINSSGIEKSAEQVLPDSQAFHVQKNRNACTCLSCRRNVSQNSNILSTLPCNFWERREFMYIDNTDNKSKVLAWAWSCVEKI